MLHPDGWLMGHGLWMISWLLIIVFLIWCVIRAVGGRSAGNAENKARKILDERFAKGEIDEQEYRRKCNELER